MFTGLEVMNATALLSSTQELEVMNVTTLL